MILPAQPGQFPDEVLESGKGGDPCDPSGSAPIYLANRDNMGKFNSGLDNVIQQVPGSPVGYWSSPTYWRAGTQAAIYYAGVTATGGTAII